MGFFHDAYSGSPPWDIGRAQREIIRLEESGEITGSVLDVGCGKGDNALFLASRGHEVLGVDMVEGVIEIARARAAERGLPATFIVHDILKVEEIGRTFDTVIDSGFFHTLSDQDRPLFVRNLLFVLGKGGRYFMLAFSDREPAGYGPRRVTQEEIRASFSTGWRIDWIRDAVFESRTRPQGSRAWLSSITRI
ncbi:MAG: tellurite resistance protein TehB [Methanoregulaceae archaeon PtaU1.Bin059]|nr:MAG: tellurite resistance protein TehB [Methanoregulaceae archaeon PtaB.Bin152]OPY39387.1 MAG: tellurite resistance protein TehB [Methanoregulaceae archaeon PtaU1.Bin059]